MGQGLGALVLAIAVMGCSGGRAAPDGAGGSAGAVGSGGSGGGAGQGAGGAVNLATRDVDILFMIDNSSSMSKAQANLLTRFPQFIQALTAFPGGLPNVHIAVVSSDMGAGTGIPGCDGDGQAGKFQATPKQLIGSALCTTGMASDATFISNIDGVPNYDGRLEDVFSCIAALGDSGCGFEQSLLSVTHALGADNLDSAGRPQPPAENAGFLRDDAYLVLVLVTNEDDCSAPMGAASDLFPSAGDGSNAASPFGPPSGFRCNAFGHLCGSPPMPPPIQSPLGSADPGDKSTAVTLSDCVPATGVGKLTPVTSFETMLRRLKRDPANQILIAAITGIYDTTTPYTVTWRKSVSADPTGPWPEVVHSCVSSSDSSFADPAVRITDLVKRFGPNGILQSICDADPSPALQKVAARLGTLMAP
jgi:hypothetical protein